ncbi:cysteine hydrolase family protein [Cryobacterium arcticum]|uniref:Hydrolase n=1 Tax=Cryobacterium arcticum TaxID=670052 RepID=A0A317ZWS7_9MICO|nr:isochorismatase family protein [Cryobacterium arcticum]PXA71823.1 hydrolase [Cryobacterium arcticum]
MTVTALDHTAALIVIDLQAGTLGAPTAHPADDIVARANDLLGAFRAQGLPVVLANVDGTPAGRTQYGEGAREFPGAFSALVPGLDQQPSDLTITRATWSAFAGTDLHALLTERGITQLVLAGIATSFGVESTARDAYDLGYSVAIAVDAITDRSAEAHEKSVAGVFPALGQTGTTAEIIALLA